ncbi:uncharacterized protein C8R40DRAFT_123312 [Lentinula edodes]|uniref:uncharacterized protein n=1 Tax=Lentinula edodes TaxID=5353 RepID=UPI001E8D606B|nr:uncharacterized protein C8R40DRAFT_123312 [Lentinula edodes]KAH7876241.1 hypothetical protein C8R40DRAFT_123312 [Lentinula edodes]
MCFSHSSGYHRYHAAGISRSSSMPPFSTSLPSQSGSRPLFSHSGSPTPLRHAPPSYNPNKVLNDQLNSWDPDSVVSKFYADQAKFFNDQKLLVSFDRETKTYQLWNAPSYGFRKLSIALQNSLLTGPLSPRQQ